jgi:hypothetical protein
MSMPANNRALLQWSLACIYLVVLLMSIAAWLVLRQPELRNELLALVPHRYQIPTALTRQLLAPRAILLAAFAGAALLGAAALFPSSRRQLFQSLPRRQRLVTGFVALQSVLALAAVINLHAYHFRTFGKPVWRLSTQEVLTHSLPQVSPDAMELKRRVPPQSAIALKPGSELVYMLASLSYPLRFYDAYPQEGLPWHQDPAFTEFARQKQIHYILRYDPFSTTDPLMLEKIR